MEQLINLTLIDPNPRQKRNAYRDIPDLARTIAIDGLQQVPKARHFGDRVQIKFGHRRREAFLWLRDHWKEENLPDRYNGYTVMPLDMEDLTDEQMYRGVTIENSQREDLSPIERMEEMKAWQEFGYSSEKIAAMYPNMTASTVRGLLAFDSLIPEAKNALHSGKITQGAARIVNTIQRLAHPSDVARLVNDVAEDKMESNRWNSDITPESYLAEEVQEMNNVHELWWDSRGGKPHARSSDHWLLDMKNFPNKHLPELTIEEASKAIGNEAENSYIASYLLRREHDRLSERTTNILQHLIEPTSCSACPFYGKIKGTHLCGIRVCYDRKERAWHRHQMHEASKKLGITLYKPETDGNYIVLQDKWSNKVHGEIYDKKSKDLRLAFMEDIDRKKSQGGYDGIPEGSVIILVGAALKKLEQKQEAVREEKKQGVDIEAMIEDMKEEKAEVLLAEASLYIKELFENFNDAAILSLAEAPSYGWGGSDIPFEEPKEKSNDKEWAGYLRREFAYRMLERSDDIPHPDDSKTLSEYAALVVKVAKSWGVKLPASFAKAAKEMDAEIEAVAAETKAQKKGKSQ